MSLIADLEKVVEDGAYWALLGERLITDPEGLFKELRGNRPVWNTPIGTLITSYEHVTEAMNCHTAFSVRLYKERMDPLVGTYPLGLDDGPDYLRDASLLRLSVAAEDAACVAEIAGAVVDGVIQEIRQSAPGPSPLSFDIVKRMAYTVPTRILALYFGIPDGEAAPGDQLLSDGLDAVFCDIFDNPTNENGLHQKAMDQSARLLTELEPVIAANDAGSNPAPGSLVIPRLVALRKAGMTARDDRALAQLVLGTVAGVVTTIAIASSHALNMLLAPENAGALAITRAAANANDDDALWLAVREAMRFAPPTGFQLRYAEHNYTFDQDDVAGTTVKANSRVLVSVGSAMQDERHVVAPREFRTDRGEEDYLMFGVGLHHCLGRFIAPKILVALFGRLLREFPDLKIAPGQTLQQDPMRPGVPLSLPVVAG